MAVMMKKKGKEGLRAARKLKPQVETLRESNEKLAQSVEDFAGGPGPSHDLTRGPRHGHGREARGRREKGRR